MLDTEMFDENILDAKMLDAKMLAVQIPIAVTLYTLVLVCVMPLIFCDRKKKYYYKNVA